jgi:uncharacterized RmlC-like cupin family protein
MPLVASEACQASSESMARSAGKVTEAHMTTGWHHHANYDTSIYVVDAPCGWGRDDQGEALWSRAGPGDFLHVPKGAIHREGNPGDEESRLVVVRAGHGPAVVNVDGPATA